MLPILTPNIQDKSALETLNMLYQTIMASLHDKLNSYSGVVLRMSMDYQVGIFQLTYIQNTSTQLSRTLFEPTK